MLEHHQIPTHLDVEDRFFYGLTMAQLAVLLLGGSLAWAIWSDGQALPTSLRAGVATTTALLTLVLALVRPGGRSLPLWGLVMLRYAAMPKRSVWRPRPAGPGAARPGRPTWAAFAPPLAWAGDGAPAEAP